MINKVLKYFGFMKIDECISKIAAVQKENDLKTNELRKTIDRLELKIENLKKENLNLKLTNGNRYKKISELLIENKRLKKSLDMKQYFPISKNIAWSMCDEI